MLAKALGLEIVQSSVLPEIILANVGDRDDDTLLVFCRSRINRRCNDRPPCCTATGLHHRLRLSSGAVSLRHSIRRLACKGARKCSPESAWGTVAWLMSEPDSVVLLQASTGFADVLLNTPCWSGVQRGRPTWSGFCKHGIQEGKEPADRSPSPGTKSTWRLHNPGCALYDRTPFCRTKP